MCAYNPGIQDRSGEYLAQGIGQLGEGIQRGMMGYAQNKQMAALALGKFEGALQANPDLLKFLNPEEPSPNAPSDAVKAFMKLQKDGTLGVRDASLLSTFADTYTKAKEDKQQAEMRAMQMQQAQMQMAQMQSQKADEDQMNARFAQMAALGRGLEGGTPMQPAMQGGPAALMGRAPDGPMALGGVDALGRAGNLGGGGVLRPEVSERARQFLQSGAGQLAAQGVKLTPAQVVALQQTDTSRLGALERATLGAESRMAQQGLRNEMGAQTAAAKADAAAAKAENDALKSGKKDSATAFDETKKLRDEFSAHPNTKNFDIVDNYYSRGVKLAKKETAAGDMGLIFSLMKVYDPSSTVREGEYATAANSGSIPAQFLNIYNKAKDGQKLQPEQRAQFIDTMSEAAQVQHQKLMGTANQYAAIAKKRGLDSEEVVAPSYVSWAPPKFGDEKKVETPATAPTPIKILSIKKAN
jgi:hypothetical protein